MPKLTVKNITSYYKFEVKEKWNLISKERLAFENISFSLSEGNRLAVVGETGSGKSSLLKSICGFLPVNSGEIWWNGKRTDILKSTEWKPIRKEIQLVLQNPMTAFNPAISIKKSLFNVLNSHFELTDSQKVDQINAEMELIKLSADLLEKRPNQLSGGQLQRFSVLRSFLLKPLLILCDEPLSALDTENQTYLMSYLHKKSEENLYSVIWVTHQMTLVDQFCDQILVLKEGKVQNYGTLAEINANTSINYSNSLFEKSGLL